MLQLKKDMMEKPFKKFLIAGFLALNLAAGTAEAAYDADSRIQTLVYNENEVFRVVARNGFQTNIELAADEVIDTISIGDSIGWQITPATKRIFVKPLQKNGVTNLSVITNKRSYQFELVATSSTTNSRDNAYVVKFYYPEENNYVAPQVDRSRGSLRPVGATPIPELPTPQVPAAPAVPAVAPLPLPGDIPSTPISVAPVQDNFNYNYTLTGPDSLAPKKIYDDGKSTFFEFANPSAGVPMFAVVRPDGSEVPVATRPDMGGSKVIVDQLSSKFTIRDSQGQLVCVFNESLNLPPVPSTKPY